MDDGSLGHSHHNQEHTHTAEWRDNCSTSIKTWVIIYAINLIKLSLLILEGGIGGGGIAAIIIAVCIVFGVTAVLVVMLKNRDWDFHRLVPPRAMDLISRRDNNNSGTRMASFPNMSYNSNSGVVQQSS